MYCYSLFTCSFYFFFLLFVFFIQSLSFCCTAVASVTKTKYHKFKQMILDLELESRYETLSNWCICFLGKALHWTLIWPLICCPTVEVAVEEREHATGEEPEHEPILISAGIIFFSLNTSASVPCRCVPHMGRCWRVQRSDATGIEAYACTSMHISPDYINAWIISIPASCRSPRTFPYRACPVQTPLTVWS